MIEFDLTLIVTKRGNKTTFNYVEESCIPKFKNRNKKYIIYDYSVPVETILPKK